MPLTISRPVDGHVKTNALIGPVAHL